MPPCIFIVRFLSISSLQHEAACLVASSPWGTRASLCSSWFTMIQLRRGLSVLAGGVRRGDAFGEVGAVAAVAADAIELYESDLTKPQRLRSGHLGEF